MQHSPSSEANSYRYLIQSLPFMQHLGSLQCAPLSVTGLVQTISPYFFTTYIKWYHTSFYLQGFLKRISYVFLMSQICCMLYNLSISWSMFSLFESLLVNTTNYEATHNTVVCGFVLLPLSCLNILISMKLISQKFSLYTYFLPTCQTIWHK